MTLTQEMLSSLHLADKTGAWGTLGTVKPLKNFEPENDVHKLAETLANKGNRQTIIDVLTKLDNDQRQEILRLYKKDVQQDLTVNLKSALSGDLENVILGLLKTPAAYAAQELKAAMKGLGTDEATLSEILCTRSSQQLQEIQAVYTQEYKTELVKDITSDTTEPYTDLLLALAKGKREKESGIIDYLLIDHDCKTLSDLGPKKSPNIAQWITILTERSPRHLKRVFDKYQSANAVDIEESIKSHFKGDFQKGLLTLVAVMKNTPLYFADRLYNAMKGMGTNEKTLARILISRSEIDLLSIRVEFRRKYGKSLYSFIKSEVKGDYQSCLLSLCRAEDI
ncbi:annexin A9 [Spea bombifrons]|uniref:annexin A9 n=1 Tax=Spea bombifrons TaxID=233779 RepID=UPI00234961D4|nr:annexin A9 [Spea bombifrons]